MALRQSATDLADFVHLEVFQDALFSCVQDSRVAIIGFGDVITWLFSVNYHGHVVLSCHCCCHL